MGLERILAVVSSSTALGLGLLYIREKSLKKSAEELAYRDPKTGLHNARYFDEQAALALKEAERYQEEAALLYVDADAFKSINDSFGHQVGDDVLREVARALKAIVRESDIVARYGGDEFLIYLKRTDGGGSKRVKKRIKNLFGEYCKTLFETLNVQGKGRLVDLPSLSIGIASAKETKYSLTDMIDLAESRMYEEKKRSGHSRN